MLDDRPDLDEIPNEADMTITHQSTAQIRWSENGVCVRVLCGRIMCIVQIGTASI